MEKYSDYKGFEITFYPKSLTTTIYRNGWSVKGFHFELKEKGLQLAKDYIDKLIEKFGNEIMKTPVYKLEDADGASL